MVTVTAVHPGDRVADVGVFLLPTLVALAIYLPHGLLMPVRLITLLLSVIATCWMARSRRATPVLAGVAVVSGAFVVFGALAAVLHPEGVQLAQAATVGFTLLLWCASAVLGTRAATVRAAVWGWLASLVVTGIVGTWEVWTGEYLPGNVPAVYWKPLDWTYDLIAATYDNPNLYAYHVVVGLLLLPVAWKLGHRWWRWLLVPFAAWQGFLLLKTSGRIALLGFLVGVLVWLLSFRRTRWVTVAVLAVFVGSALLGLPPGNHAADFLHLDQAAVPGSSIWVRGVLLQSALWMAEQTTYLGTGPGGFDYWALLPENPHQFEGLNNAHFGLGEVLAEYGVFTLVILLAAMVASVVVAYQWGHDDPLRRAMGAAAAALTVSSVLLSMSHSTWLRQPLMGAHLGLVVMLLAACCPAREKPAATIPPQSDSKTPG